MKLRRSGGASEFEFAVNAVGRGELGLAVVMFGAAARQGHRDAPQRLADTRELQRVMDDLYEVLPWEMRSTPCVDCERRFDNRAMTSDDGRCDWCRFIHVIHTGDD